MSDLSQTAKSTPQVTMGLRIKRAGSEKWIDGPEVNTAIASLSLFARVKLSAYKRLLKGFDAIQSKLEEHK